jgi:hypothetical protein
VEAAQWAAAALSTESGWRRATSPPDLVGGGGPPFGDDCDAFVLIVNDVASMLICDVSVNLD